MFCHWATTRYFLVIFGVVLIIFKCYPMSKKDFSKNLEAEAHLPKGVQGAARSGQIKLSGANGPLFVGEAHF